MRREQDADTAWSFPLLFPPPLSHMIVMQGLQQAQTRKCKVQRQITCPSILSALLPLPPSLPSQALFYHHLLTSNKRTCQGEHANAAQKARKKGIEWEGAHNDTVEELENARHQNESQEKVHNFGLGGGTLLVLGHQALAHALDVHGLDGGYHACDDGAVVGRVAVLGWFVVWCEVRSEERKAGCSVAVLAMRLATAVQATPNATITRHSTRTLKTSMFLLC